MFSTALRDSGSRINNQETKYTPGFFVSGFLPIPTKEIAPKTMESRLIKGLYFAGEIINLDAETGGYNLQIAWSTGWLAGNSVFAK